MIDLITWSVLFLSSERWVLKKYSEKQKKGFALLGRIRCLGDEGREGCSSPSYSWTNCSRHLPARKGQSLRSKEGSQRKWDAKENLKYPLIFQTGQTPIVRQPWGAPDNRGVIVTVTFQDLHHQRVCWHHHPRKAEHRASPPRCLARIFTKIQR